jgi:hypothetical protein
MKSLRWRYTAFTLVLALAVSFIVGSFDLRLDDDQRSILLISGLVLYLVTTNGLLYLLWREPPPGSRVVRIGRIASILLLGAPTLGGLIAYMVIMDDIGGIALPVVAAPFALIAPLWVLALRRSLRKTPTSLSEVF